MNNILKAQIVLRYGTQSDFAVAVGMREDLVSRIVRERISLPDLEQQRWATLLDADVERLFRKETINGEAKG